MYVCVRATIARILRARACVRVCHTLGTVYVCVRYRQVCYAAIHYLWFSAERVIVRCCVYLVTPGPGPESGKREELVYLNLVGHTDTLHKLSCQPAISCGHRIARNSYLESR